MPRPVVPILRSPRAASRARSSAPCSGRISGGVLGDAERGGRDFEALGADPVHFGEQRLGVDDDAVADDPELAADEAGGQQGELVGLVADDERVAGVVAALEADDDLGAAGQPVHDLAFAFVAPLGADHGDVGHSSSSSQRSADGAVAGRACSQAARLGRRVCGGTRAATVRSPRRGVGRRLRAGCPRAGRRGGGRRVGGGRGARRRGRG